MRKNICTEQDCTNEVKVAKRGLCATHYMYWAQANKPRVGVKECEVEQCSLNSYAKGYCRNHYANYYRCGDPLGSRGPAPTETCPLHPQRVLNRNGKCRSCVSLAFYYDGPKNPRGPRKEVVGYAAAHCRVRSVKGRAANHLCVDCGHQALSWTLKYGASQITTEAEGIYKGTMFSLNIDDYEPRCEPCHRVHDKVYGMKKKNCGWGNSPRYEVQKAAYEKRKAEKAAA